MKSPCEELIDMLGQPYDAGKVARLLGPLGVKRMPRPSSHFDDDIIWSAKSSLRIDVYRPRALSRLTGRDWEDGDVWLIGSVHFLAPEADSRIRAVFAGSLPSGLSMRSAPEALVAVFGPPQMDDGIERPGHGGRLLAWRKPQVNIVAEYEDAGEAGSITSFVVCLIGCIGAWRHDDPEVFAP